jgi:hypothetical protein
LDVAEAFITPSVGEAPESAPHCYSELDISPGDVMFESGIYNPNLNHTGISGTLINCSTSDVLHSTDLSSLSSGQSWTASLAFPWVLLNCPRGCPITSDYCVGNITERKALYRANFFRINQLLPGSDTKCSSSTCEYLSWSPTMQDPPAFHEPNYFGYLVMK